MKKQLPAALLAAAMIIPAAAPTAATAQRYGDRDYRWQNNRADNWDPSQHYRYDRHARERRLGRNDYVYRGSNGRYYCRRSDGTTGLVVGAIGGGVLGNILGGGGALGTLLGAGGGALLGRSVDRGNVRCR